MKARKFNSVFVSHIFSGFQDHLVLPIIASIIAHSSLRHRFIILNPGVLKENYVEFFLAHNIYEYIFITNSIRELTRSRFLFGRRVAIYLLPTLSCGNLLRIGRYCRGKLFLHGFSLNILSMLLFRLMRVHLAYVSWGLIITPNNRLCKVLMKINYAMYENIVCLMLPEKLHFENVFQLKNTLCLPYMYESIEMAMCPSVVPEAQQIAATVIVGNSSWSFDFYPEV